MPFESFREFLEHLESNGQLKRIKRVVDRKLETAIVTKKAIESKGPALLFENVKGYDGVSLAAGVYGSRERICIGLDTTEHEFAKDWVKRSDRLAPSKVVKTGACKENVATAKDVNVNMFPIVWHAPADSGYFLDAPVAIAKDMDTGKRNASVHRHQVYSNNRIGIYFHPPYHLYHIAQKYFRQKEPCPIALAIGVDPAVMMAASSRIPWDVDEFDFAGALRGKPVEMVECETIDLEVPATSEIIVEGFINPEVRVSEAPFVEFTGYYGAETKSPVIDITAITWRNNPIYHDIITGTPPDENCPMHIPLEAEVYKTLTRIVPPDCIKDVYLTDGGCVLFNLIVSMRKQGPGQAKLVISAALSYNQVKNVVVVDDDIDARNPTMVEWAMSTRSRAEDMIVIHDTLGVTIDPTSREHSGLVTKIGIDATRPLREDKIAGESVNHPAYLPTHEVRLEDYLNP